MAPHIIVFDIETQKSFDDVGGKQNLSDLGVSVLGAYFYRTDTYEIFTEAELKKFEQHLSTRPTLVGFNTKRFDLPVLRPYLQFDPTLLAHIDLLEDISLKLGHRVSLDSVAAATLGSKKSGNGLDAIRYFQNGEIAKLKQYCLDDVRLTREIFEYGVGHQEILYTSKYGGGKGRCPVAWKLPTAESTADQLALF